MLIVLKLEDRTDKDIYHTIVCETTKGEEEIQSEVDKIIKSFEEKPYYKDDWNFLDIVFELEERGFIREVKADFYKVFA